MPPQNPIASRQILVKIFVAISASRGHFTACNRKSEIYNLQFRRGCNSMVEWQLPKLHTRVRFPSPALSSSSNVETFGIRDWTLSYNSATRLDYPTTNLRPLLVSSGDS